MKFPIVGDTMDLSEISAAKYALRTKSLLKRLESERSRHCLSGKKKDHKEKEKPAPLSKYRRKTANARERNRMKEINDAFIGLQGSLPDIPGTDADKLTKITVLKLAVNYINALAGVLNGATRAMDVEGIREMWCLDNAQLAKSEQCVKTIVKSTEIKKEEIVTKIIPKPPPINNKNTNYTPKKKPLTNQVNKLDITKEKFLHTTIKPTAKKAGKSRSRGKICRTNHVATSNGAYITLKNCAMQTTHNPRARAANNQPIMMSMTVKRTRMGSLTGHRSIKIRKFEPLVYSNNGLFNLNNVSQRLQPSPIITVKEIKTATNFPLCNINNDELFDTKPVFSNIRQSPQYNFFPLQNNTVDKPSIIQRLQTPQYCSEIDTRINFTSHYTPSQINQTSLNTIEKSPYHQPVAETTQYLSVQTSTDCFAVSEPTFMALDSPPVRNDVLLEFPRETKLLSSSDSAFSSGESAPSSPTLSLHSHTPPLDDLSPFSSLTNLSGGSSSGCSISSTDCDSVFNSLLECEPFQEELDHITSTFSEGSNFNLFIDHSSSAFVNSDIDGY